MKEINGQLYGYSYELDATTEEDLTTCFAVDTGTIFVAYSGVWYEQPGSKWAAGGGSGGGGGGGGGGVLFAHAIVDENTGVLTLDKTWQEIYDADFTVVRSTELWNYSDWWYVSYASDGTDGNPGQDALYQVALIGLGLQPYYLSTDSANGYPDSSERDDDGPIAT